MSVELLRCHSYSADALDGYSMAFSYFPTNILIYDVKSNVSTRCPIIVVKAEIALNQLITPAFPEIELLWENSVINDYLNPREYYLSMRASPQTKIDVMLMNHTDMPGLILWYSRCRYNAIQ